MPPHQLPEIKRLIRGMRIEAARQLAADVLLLATAEEVVERLTSALYLISPERHNGSADRLKRMQSRRESAARSADCRPFAILGHRACETRIYEVRSATLFGLAARQLLLLHKIGQTAPHHLDPPRQAFLCRPIDDGESSASPKEQRRRKSSSYRARAASEVERGVRVRGI